MPGIYIHIPFCKSVCRYCDFYRGTDVSLRSEMVSSLCRELELRKGFLGGQAVGTVYLGGGTPSLLYTDEISRMLRTLKRNYQMEALPEITFEANPDDCSKDYLEKLIKMGINRISIGVQSFHDKTLGLLGRRHSAKQAQEAVRMAKEAGFRNLSIDLIYGITGQCLREWQADIEHALQLDVEHISAYALSIEEGAELRRWLHEGRYEEMDEEKSLAQYELLIDRLEEAGYEHYEISNFARRGHYSRHNSSYWKGEKYLGIGPAAHSYSISHRYHNPADTEAYIASLSKGGLAAEEEKLSLEDNYNEYLMTRLRTIWGLDMREIRLHFGEGLAGHLEKGCHKWIESGHMRLNGDHLKMNRKGFFLSDGIIASLFV